MGGRRLPRGALGRGGRPWEGGHRGARRGSSQLPHRAGLGEEHRLGEQATGRERAPPSPLHEASGTSGNSSPVGPVNQ